MADEPIEQGNPGAVDLKGNPAPPPPSNDPPAPTGPSAEDKAALAAAEKLVADNKAAKEKKPEPAPAPAPAPEPDPEGDPPKKDEPKEDSPLDTTKWGSTGHEGGDAVLGLLQNAGMEPAEAKEILFDAIMAGDLKQVDEAKLIEKIGADKAKLVMIGAKNFVADRATKNAGIVKDLEGVAGGEDNWKKVAAWAKNDSDISDDAMAEYITMIDGGGPAARFAATELVTAYNASDKNTTLDTPGVTTPVEGDSSNTPGGRSLTRNEYATAVAKAHERGRLPPQAELDELSAARRRGRTGE